jgi:nucleotide-binding universal stress UspA family protein
MSSTVRLSADAVVEMEAAFDELQPELRAQAARQLRGGAAWEFERRHRVIVIGSSSHATHHVVGSVAVSLARHSPVPLVIVP